MGEGSCRSERLSAKLARPAAYGLDDDGDAVAAHDEQRPRTTRHATVHRHQWRMNMKVATDPFTPATERQVLVGLAVLSALGVWRLNAKG